MPYRPPSERDNYHPSRGPVIFCCLLGLIAAFIAFVIYENSQPQPQAAQSAVKPPQKPAAPDTSYAENNVLRNNDARALWYAGGDFYRTNFVNGVSAYPQHYRDGALTGVDGTKPKKVAFTYYKAADVAEGAQSGVKKDIIRFVFNAACSPTGGDTVLSKQGYDYVIQYSNESQDGSFSPMCLKL